MTGVVKQSELLSLFQKKQDKFFLSKICYHINFL